MSVGSRVFFIITVQKKKMKDKITAIKVNLRLLLKRVEELKIDKPDYDVNAKLQKAELKVDELSDLITEIDCIIND